MQFSEKIDQIAQALSQFQGMMESIPKTKTAIVETANGGSYQYKYADLADIASYIKKPMKECGLSWHQEPVMENGEKVGVYTIIMHKSGQYMIFNPVMIRQFGKGKPQDTGSAYTYARRYSLCMALGIAADEDTDANDIQPGVTNFKTESVKKKQQSKKAAAPARPVAQARAQEQAAESKPEEKPAPASQTVAQAQEQPAEDRNLNAWKALAEENKQQQPKKETNQRGRFFAICAKRGIKGEKAQKALVFKFTGKLSRAEVANEEYKTICDFLEKASNEEVVKEINEGAESLAKFLAKQEKTA